MRTLSIDIETYSSVDLAKGGVYRYAQSPDFEILLFGYSADGGSVQAIDLACGEVMPPEILAALTDTSVTKWAFNAQFERVCLSKWLGLPAGEYLSPRSWRCTMVWSAYMGLPLSLEGAGAVLGLKKQKLTEGKDLIRFFCNPRGPSAANGSRTRNLPAHSLEKWAAFKAYNRRDVEAETAIQEKLAKFPVPENVWEEYHLDQEINDRGVALDMEFVRGAIKADDRSRAELTRLMCEITMGINRFNAERYPDPTAYEAMTNILSAGKPGYKPLVYICSPYAGDIETNLLRARRYCRFAVGKGCLPLAPHLHFPQFMDDGDREQRELGLRFAVILLCKCDELWVFGDRVSEGMAREIAKAKRRDMPIHYFTVKCEVKKYGA